MKGKILFSALLAFSAAAHASGVGTTGANFLKVGVGARGLAMGGAFSALADDANAVNWNPAGFSAVKERNITASYNSLFLDQSQGFLGYAHPLKDGKSVLAIGMNSIVVSDIEKRATDSDTADSAFDNTNRAYSVSYARADIAGGLSFGASLKYITEKLDSFSESAGALDLGVTYKPEVENLVTGFSVQNIGARMGPDPLPLTAKGGAAYKFGGLTVALDGDWQIADKRFYLDLGGEYWLSPGIAARAGYQLGRGGDELGGLTGAAFGLGFKFRQFALDYAFVPFGDLGDTHRLTLGMKL